MLPLNVLQSIPEFGTTSSPSSYASTYILSQSLAQAVEPFLRNSPKVGVTQLKPCGQKRPLSPKTISRLLSGSRCPAGFSPCCFLGPTYQPPAVCHPGCVLLSATGGPKRGGQASCARRVIARRFRKNAMCNPQSSRGLHLPQP